MSATPLRRTMRRAANLLYRTLSAVMAPRPQPDLPPELRFPPF